MPNNEHVALLKQGVANTRFAFNRTPANQPFSLFCEQPIAGRDVAISFSQPLNGSRYGERFKFGRSLPILRDATHLAFVLMNCFCSENGG